MTAPQVTSSLGSAWIERDNESIRIDLEDIPAVVAALLVEQDRLIDASDDTVIGISSAGCGCVCHMESAMPVDHMSPCCYPSAVSS